MNFFRRHPIIASTYCILIALLGYAITLDITRHEVPHKFGATVPQTSPLFDTVLSAPLGSGDTTMYLQSVTTAKGSVLSGVQCVTVDTGNPNVEYVCGTVSGLNLTNLIRNIDGITGTTTAQGTVPSHRTGADVRITDFPALTILGNQANGIESYPKVLFYASTVASTSIASNPHNLVDVDLLNSIVFSGAPNASQITKGIVQISTGLQAASSTTLGSTGAILVLPSGIATDTPNTGSNKSVIPVTNLFGFLNWAWMDFTKSLTWTGLNMFSGGLTSTATSTFAGSNALSNAIIINTVPYSFPSMGIASGTHWSFDVNGNATYEPDQGYAAGQFSTTTNSIGPILVSHSLGAAPRLISIKAFCNSGTNSALANSTGDFIQATGANTSTWFALSSGGAGTTGQNSSNIVDLRVNGADAVLGTISAVTSSTFTLSVTTNTGCGTGTSFYQWEAYK